jgi:hypothetical protein
MFLFAVPSGARAVLSKKPVIFCIPRSPAGRLVGCLALRVIPFALRQV